MAKVYAPTKLSENISKTPEGYLLCKNVPIARTGTMEYGEGETPLEVGDDGKILIDRDPEEVFDKKTIASFEGKSVTIKHPEEFVNPKNWAALSKGILRNVRKSDEKDENGEECLLADLLITDSFAITLVESGLREVSCGYEAEYEQTGKGKGRQSNIVGNHLALVEESRAGSSYAINDHKGKDIIPMKTFKELKDKLAELVKVVDAATKDGEGAVETKVSKKAGSETNKVFDEESMDELVKAVKDLSDKVDGMMKPKDEKEHEEEESEDEGDMEAQILERVKALEAAMAKMLEGKSKDDDEEEESEDDDEEEESEDDDEEEESEDDDEEEKEKPKKTGDAARAEILAPGIKVSKKNLKVEALKAAYKTNEGKAVINILTGGKKPTYDSAEKVSTLFLAASELLKTKRKNELEKTKDGSSFESFDHKNETMTAEKMNELNEKHWASINKGK